MADYDASGSVNVEDLHLFLADFLARSNTTVINDPADFNRSGYLSVADLLEFLSSWFSACD